AKLAKLNLTEEEIIRFTSQLTEVLNFVEKINRVETKDTPPLFNVAGKQNIMREDVVRPSLTQEEALANAKETYKGYFKVKAVLG
ncbi:MAG: Asp-tRNA(Asn)/Glu-tRNA(Gln) amidotransferase subunit GatC, partial [Patescibacteria group bacterium]|nr:Asp-tRNA(Asn)/Glu-tRNA(Gln) amidotransferase subunit GatC [Patescibacteria group bacterium]